MGGVSSTCVAEVAMVCLHAEEGAELEEEDRGTYASYRHTDPTFDFVS
jgi:hypothetical protein